MERALALYRSTSSAVAAGLLVAVNLVPLAGVLWWGWDLAAILALYWVENGIVGAYNVLKILRAEGTALPGPSRMSINGRPIESLARGPIAFFFLIHYGTFWVGHGIFVLAFLPMMAGGGGEVGLGVGPGVGPDWSLVRLGVMGLAVSHGASFWLNYLGRREYRSVSPGQLMLAPYGRLVILHLTIILGAMLSIWIGSPVGALVVLVALKTALDLVFHLREHRRVAGSGPTSAGA